MNVQFLTNGNMEISVRTDDGRAELNKLKDFINGRDTSAYFHEDEFFREFLPEYEYCVFDVLRRAPAIKNKNNQIYFWPEFEKINFIEELVAGRPVEFEKINFIVA